ncbi:MAG: PASTA domain-containing protein [Bacteroidota bacterium]
MRILDFFKKNTLGGVLANLGVAFAVIIVISICYFYIYLPNSTCHDCSITVPDLAGMKYADVEKFLGDHDLRFEVEDSVYHDQYPPLTVLRQFPKAGAIVKPNRIIYVSVNPVLPPMVPMPDLANPANAISRIGAEAILKSTGLKRGRIIQRPHGDLNLVLEIRYQGKKIEPGTKIPKGSVIDLVIADGNGTSDFVLGSLLNDTYSLAQLKLDGWGLRLGQVFPENTNTITDDLIVYKTNPLPGDSVRAGDPIDLYVCPKDKIPEEELEEPDDNTENKP